MFYTVLCFVSITEQHGHVPPEGALNGCRSAQAALPRHTVFPLMMARVWLDGFSPDLKYFNFYLFLLFLILGILFIFFHIPLPIVFAQRRVVEIGGMYGAGSVLTSLSFLQLINE